MHRLNLTLIRMVTLILECGGEPLVYSVVDICVAHLQDLDQQQQHSAKAVAGREKGLERNVELDEERYVEINIDTLVNPLAAVRCDALMYTKNRVD